MPEDTAATLGEDGIIALFLDDRRPPDTVVIPNGDDAAAWRFAPDEASVITTDSLVEGQHFDLAYTPPQHVGRKLMTVNLSDLAAMGARPAFVLLSVCFDRSTPAAVIQQVAHGVRAGCRVAKTSIIGGNTTGIAGPMVLTATVIGARSPHGLLKRSGACAGQAIYVSGTLGDAAAGLHLVLAGGRPSPSSSAHRLFERLTNPTARTELGQRLSESGIVHAMCDISDGFGRDLRRLLAYDNLGATVDVMRMPTSGALRAYAAERDRDPASFAMAGGEDYELLFTADAEKESLIADISNEVGVAVTRVGLVTATGQVRARHPDGRHTEVPTGFEHFETQ
ncbi:MAG: thiamine-phosphate kinase [Myxococcota bacterium]